MSNLENVQQKVVCNDDKVENAVEKEKKCSRNVHNKLPVEGSGSLELNLYKSSKAWKKSITHFFRNQLRSTRSNDGEPSSSNEHFPETEMSPEQKWQSLGKMFRRRHDSPPKKGTNPEEHPHKKSLALKKVLSNYFGKNPKN